MPVRTFYEVHMTERVPSPVIRKPAKRQYTFCLSDPRAFLLAAVQIDGMFSIVTTVPNISVASAHDHMPIVLGAGRVEHLAGPRLCKSS